MRGTENHEYREIKTWFQLGAETLSSIQHQQVLRIEQNVPLPSCEILQRLKHTTLPARAVPGLPHPGEGEQGGIK